MKKKILIFYISKKSGHYQAAMAIEKGFAEIGKEVSLETINAFEYTNPILEKIINKAYLEVIKKNPDFWGHIYDNPDVMKKTKRAREALHKFNMSKIKKLLDKVSPDIVFCTQAFPCGMVADYKRATGRKVLLAGVMTDHAPHSYWIHDEVDFYITPSAAVGSVLVQKGVANEKIREYGIPVDPKFRIEHNKDEIKKQFGLNKNLPTILIMGGNHGLGVIEDVLLLFLENEIPKYQFIIVAGSNKRLFSKLNKICKKKNAKNFKIFSFTDDIDLLMDVADLIVTKAGGMTVAEALVKSLPILLVKPIPGHERMNADFLLKNGAAIEAREYGEIYSKINKLFDSEYALKNMTKNIKNIAAPNSSRNIAELAFQNR